MTTYAMWRIPSDAATISCATADSDYPAANVQLPHVNSAESLRDDGTSTAFRVVFDMGAAYSCSGVFVGGHTILSTATNLKLQAHTANSWGTPDFSVNLTRRDSEFFQSFTEQTKRYWSLALTKANAAEIVQISRLAIGTAFEFVQPPSERSVEFGGQEDTRTNRTPGGASFSSVAAHLKTLRFRVEFMGQTQKDELSMLSETMGLHSPFVVSIDEENQPATGMIYGKLASKLKFRDRVWSSQVLYDTDVDMVEEK